MKSNKVINTIFLFLIIVLHYSCENDTPDHTNVILILTDDLGYADLSCYGAINNETPNLDKLASEGFKSNGYNTAQAVCSASRAGLLTGLYPNRIGIHNAFMPNSKIGINSEEFTLAEWFKQNNYETAILGKWHLGDQKKFLPLQHGFDYFYGIPFSNDMWPFHPQQGSVFNFGPLPLIENNEIIDTIEDQSNLTTELTKKAKEFIASHKEEAFFLYLAHPQPHVPLAVSSKFKGKSQNGLYGDVIMEIDWSVGEIIGALKENKLEKNTMVIFTSDNGPWLSYGNHAGSSGIYREGKGTAWEGGHRVPFIVWQPGKIPSSTQSREAFYAIDVFPSLISHLELGSVNLQFDGRDRSAIWKNQTYSPESEIFFYYYKTNELHAVREGEWKLVFPHNYRSMEGQINGVDGLPGDYKYIDLEQAELYNLKLDPSEKNNVYKDNLDIVLRLEVLASNARKDLGDRLTNKKGEGSREPGLSEE